MQVLNSDYLLKEMNGDLRRFRIYMNGDLSYPSLDVFCEKLSSRIMDKYVVHTKDYKRENGINYMPAYMAPFLFENKENFPPESNFCSVQIEGLSK